MNQKIRRWGSFIPLLLFLGVLFYLIKPCLSHYYTKYQKEQWDQGAAYVAERAKPGDLILFNATWVQIPFEYYYRHSPIPVEMKGLPVDLFDRDILEPKMALSDVPYMIDLLRGKQRLWLVYSHEVYTDPDRIIIRSLDRMFDRTDSKELVGLDILLFEGRRREEQAAELLRYLNVRVSHHFSLNQPNANKVSVAGTFNGWDSREHYMTQDVNGVWRMDLEVPLGQHQYEFRINDDQWMSDPANPVSYLAPGGYTTSIFIATAETNNLSPGP
jgi:hypothetical protein